MKLYVVGCEYDDFCDGGFSVVGIYDSKGKAEYILKSLKEKYPKANYCCKLTKLNTHYAWSINNLDNEL